MASAFENMMSGFQAGTNLRLQREEEDRRQRLNTLAQRAYGASGADRSAAIGEAIGVDAGAGMSLDNKFADMDQRRNVTVSNAAKMLMNAPEQYRPALYAKMRGDLAQYIPNMPEQYDATVADAAKSIVSAYGGGGEANSVQSRFINDKGEMVALMRDGSTAIVGKADPSMQIIEGDGGFYGVNRRNLNAAPVQLGGAVPQQSNASPQKAISNVQYRTEDGQPIPQEEMAALQQAMQAAEAGQDVIVPVGGTPQFGGQLRPKQQQISPAEAQRLAMERERLDMQRQEAEARRQANAVTGKAPTGDERAAFGYLERMQAASQLLTNIEQQGYTPGSYRDYVAANNSGMSVLGPLFNSLQTPQGQQYRQAQEDWVRAKLRKESGAVIGDEEMEREIRVYFPQPGDMPQVIQQKASARIQAEKQMASMAGRAAPQAGAQPKPTNQPRRLKFNPQTGRLE